MLRAALLTAAAATCARAASAARTLTVTNKCASGGVVVATAGSQSAVAAPGGGWRLAPGASFALTWPQDAASPPVTFSGNFAFCADAPAGRCACDADAAGGACRFADDGPRTLAEVTLQARGEDFYDISIINGVSGAAALGPARAGAAAAQLLPTAAAPFHCATAGGSDGVAAGLGAASWSLEPPSPHYRAVRGGSGAACDAAMACAAAGEECGLAKALGASPSFRLVCGEPLGYWTSAQVCGSDAGYDMAPFSCATPIAHGPSAASTRWSYYGCTEGIGSCFSAGATDACCGCSDWPDVAGVPRGGTGPRCEASNPEWAAVALPHLVWLKRACPSCYVYPYDDESSTFTCSAIDAATGLNELGYELVFCPDGAAALA
jgi:hypothetical protein